MDLLIAFFVAFAFSFVGTIPPGTMNLTIIQMGLEHKVQPAWRFAAASAIVEYLYGWIAVEFQNRLLPSSRTIQHFELLSAIVMLVLGTIGLISGSKTSNKKVGFTDSGFRKGILMGVLNPLALPFWIAVTTYLKAQEWVALKSKIELHVYLLGVALGGFALLITFFTLARKVVQYLEGNTWIKKIPALTLLLLGIYAMIRYLW